MKSDIGVVIVTCNRLRKLKNALEMYDKQTVFPQYIVVLDNASNDGTYEYLNAWRSKKAEYEKYVINEEVNLGGSGGFNHGLAKAITLDANWIWVSDDDAYPFEDTIEKAQLFIDSNDIDNLAAFCATVYDKNGCIELRQRKRIYHQGLSIHMEEVPEAEYQKNLFELNAFSYVGTAMQKDILGKAGLTNMGYYIWYDDNEHSLRISQFGKIVCITNIGIKHDNDPVAGQIDWRTFYGLRNSLDMCKKHMPKICYGNKVMLRFARMVWLYLKNDKAGYYMYKKSLWDSVRGRLGKDPQYGPE